MRAELKAIVDSLLASSKASGEIALDAIGEAIGVRAISAVEIDAMMTAFEKAGRKVVGPQGGDGEAQLKAVVAAARSLAPELGRKATITEIAERAGLSVAQVHHALALLEVMQR